jgi:hypothetical protein
LKYYLYIITSFMVLCMIWEILGKKGFRRFKGCGKRFLRLMGPSGPRVLRFDRPEGCGIAAFGSDEFYRERYGITLSVTSAA